MPWITRGWRLMRLVMCMFVKLNGLENWKIIGKLESP